MVNLDAVKDRKGNSLICTIILTFNLEYVNNEKFI